MKIDEIVDFEKPFQVDLTVCPECGHEDLTASIRTTAQFKAKTMEFEIIMAAEMDYKDAMAVCNDCEHIWYIGDKVNT